MFTCVRRLAVVPAVVLATAALSSLLHAQATRPAGVETPAVTQADRAPIRRVVLYKSGIGYFEHVGRVRDAGTLTIAFTSGQLDDVLKSLTTVDLGGGRIAGVNYDSEAGLGRRIAALGLPLGPQATRAELLTALRGAEVEVASGASRVRGRLLSVERVSQARASGAPVPVDAVTIVMGSGAVRTVPLTSGVDVRVLERGLAADVSEYLSLIASVRDRDVRSLSIATAGSGERDILVSYVSEVPVWKVSYRLVLPAPGGAPLFQGWAIVDNTVGQDWENVQLSLVAGAPQSFVQRISQPHYLQRPIVPVPGHVTLAPQTHQAGISRMGGAGLAGTVTDSGGGAVPGATVRVTRGGQRVTEIVTDARGRYQLASLPPGRYDVTFSLMGFQTATRSGVDVSSGLQTVVDAVLAAGNVGESITVRGLPRSSINQTLDGVNIGDNPLAAASAFRAGVNTIVQTQATAVTAADLGELFEYRLKEPVTIRQNQSALVPIINAEVQADAVSIWNPNRNRRQPLRAVWLTNSTGLTLDAGSFSVIEADVFAGEGLIEPLKAGERRLLSFADDLGMFVDASAETMPSRITRVRIADGVLVQETEERQRRTYIAQNADDTPRDLVIEHPARAGWTIDSTVSPAESTPDWHRFRVTVPPGVSTTFVVDERRPIQSQYQVSSLTDALLAVLVREGTVDPATEAQLHEVIDRKGVIARLDGDIVTRRTEIERIGRDQERLRENMRVLKGTSEERQLLQRYVRQLDEQETRLAAVRAELRALETERATAAAELAAFIRTLGT